MDFIDQVGALLGAAGLASGPIVFTPLDKVAQGVAVLPAPSGGATRYLDHDRWFPVLFQVQTKCLDQRAAYGDILRAVQMLDGLATLESADQSFKFQSCEVYTQPTLVTVSEQDAYIYAAIFTAEINY